MSERERFYFYQDKFLLAVRKFDAFDVGVYALSIMLSHSDDEPFCHRSDLGVATTSHKNAVNSALSRLQTAGKVRIDGERIYPKRILSDLEKDPRSKYFKGLEN